MNLQNGYTVLNEKTADGERTFIARGPEVEDKEFGPFAIGEFKLVYEKDGQIYGSTAGIPTAEDTCFDTFNAIFVAEEAEDSKAETPVDPEDAATPVDPDNSKDESTGATDPENTSKEELVEPEGGSTSPESPEGEASANTVDEAADLEN